MLYLVDKPLADAGFRAARDDPDATVVLLQDGVLLEPALDAPTYAIRRDAEVRGADLADDIEPLSYDGLVELLFDHEVASFV
jgi:tRNA 2-thiouridine synthesizing protein B